MVTRHPIQMWKWVCSNEPNPAHRKDFASVQHVRMQAKSTAIPCELGVNKGSKVNERNFENVNLYREIVASLIYLITCTTPDFCYVVTYLSQHLSKPMKAHYAISKQVLRYLKGTQDRC